MAFSYQGRQYREDGAPLDASGNVLHGGSWINPGGVEGFELTGMRGPATAWETANPWLARGVGTPTDAQRQAQQASQAQLNLNPTAQQQALQASMIAQPSPNHVWNRQSSQWDAPLSTMPMNLGGFRPAVEPQSYAFDPARHGGPLPPLGSAGGGENLMVQHQGQAFDPARHAWGGVSQQQLQQGSTPWGGVPPQQLQPAVQAPQSPQGGGGNMYLSNNPHLGAMADEIGRRSRLDRDSAFNDIRSNSIGVGGYGGSRMGVAQGLATARSNDALTGNLANLYGGQYNMDANRELSRYGADQTFFTAQRGQDFAGADLAMRMQTQAAENEWIAPRNAANIYGNFSGLGNTTNTQNSGGGWMGAAGGALGAAQLGKNLGWW